MAHLNETELINALIERVLEESSTVRRNSVHSDDVHDGRASKLKVQAMFYEYGRNHVIPPEWKEYRTELELKADPEWAEYKRLCKKFGGLS